MRSIRSRSDPGAIRMSEGGARDMGEKGNLLDMGEEIFANLAEQGPQFWLDYERYKLSRPRVSRHAWRGSSRQRLRNAMWPREMRRLSSTGRHPGPPGRRPGRWSAKAARCWPCSAAAIGV